MPTLVCLASEFCFLGTAAETLPFPSDSWYLVTFSHSHVVARGTGWATGQDGGPRFSRPESKVPGAPPARPAIQAWIGKL